MPISKTGNPISYFLPSPRPNPPSALRNGKQTQARTTSPNDRWALAGIHAAVPRDRVNLTVIHYMSWTADVVRSMLAEGSGTQGDQTHT